MTIFIIIFSQSTSLAEQLRTPSVLISGWTKGKYTVDGNGEKSSSFDKTKINFMEYLETRYEIITRGDTRFYRIHGISEYFNRHKVEEITIIKIGEYLIPVSYETVRKNLNGEIIDKREVRLDDPSWNYPNDLYHLQSFLIIGLSVAEKYRKEKQKEINFYAWLPDLQKINLILKVEGEEKISDSSPPATYIKIKMIPDIKSVMPVGKFMAPVIMPFVPGIEFWISDKEHVIKKAVGVFGPPGSPNLIYELTDYRLEAIVN